MVEIAGYVDGDVKAHQIVQVKSGGLGTADQGTGQGIHFFDGIPVIKRVVRSLHARHGHEAVADEIGTVIAANRALAQHIGAEAQHEVDNLRIGTRVRNDLEQAQVTRRIEEMRAQETPRELLGQTFGNAADGNARGIRADDGVRLDNLRQTSHQRALDIEVLDDDLDDPIGVADSLQVVFNVADFDIAQVIGTI